MGPTPNLNLKGIALSSLRLDSLRLVWIEVLQAVAEAENISEAARGLGISQSTASRHIQALEKWLGQEVVVRGGVDDPQDAGVNAGITDVGREVCAWADEHMPILFALRTAEAQRRELLEAMTLMVGKVRADLADPEPCRAAQDLAPQLDTLEHAIEALKEVPDLEIIEPFHRALRHTFTVYEAKKGREGWKPKKQRRKRKSTR